MNPMTPEQIQLLQQLQDIALPEPIGWWPLSHLTWVLITGLTGLISGFIWYRLDQRRKHAYRREAQQQLETILQTENPEASPSDKILQINCLLKQVALTYYGRHDTAGLTGQAWIAFLKQNCVTLPQPENLYTLLQHAYAQQATQAELDTFADYAKRWIKGHHQ